MSFRELTEDLKTPLAAIKAGAANIKHPDAYLIQQNAEAIEELILHHKELAELGTPNLTKNRIDEIALDIIEHLKPQAETCTLGLEADARHALCDKHQIKSALTHLLINSLLYNQDYGRTTLKLQNAGQHVLVEIKDNAIAIPKNRRTEIARRIIEAHGSKFLQDQDKNGTTTSFLLKTGL